MESLSKMYFSDSIAKMHHKRIRKQLENGNTKMKRDIHPIVMRLSGSNLFQYIELQEYLKIYQVSKDYILLGAVKNYDEFTLYVEGVINSCLALGIELKKTDILNYLKGLNNE